MIVGYEPVRRAHRLPVTGHCACVRWGATPLWCYAAKALFGRCATERALPEPALAGFIYSPASPGGTG
jgi:hypothetical protein